MNLNILLDVVGLAGLIAATVAFVYFLSVHVVWPILAVIFIGTLELLGWAQIRYSGWKSRREQRKRDAQRILPRVLSWDPEVSWDKAACRERDAANARIRTLTVELATQRTEESRALGEANVQLRLKNVDLEERVQSLLNKLGPQTVEQAKDEGRVYCSDFNSIANRCMAEAGPALAECQKIMAAQTAPRYPSYNRPYPRLDREEYMDQSSSYRGVTIVVSRSLSKDALGRGRSYWTWRLQGAGTGFDTGTTPLGPNWAGKLARDRIDQLHAGKAVSL